MTLQMMKQTSITKNGFGGNYDSDDSGNYSGKYIFSSSVLLEQGERRMKKETDFTLPEEYLNKSNLIPKVEQIELLAKHILDLQKDKGYLTDKVRELEQENEQIKNSDTLCKLIGEQKRKIAELETHNERLCQSITDFQNREAGLESQIAELKAQVEKMKCCENCAWWYKLPNGQRDCAETCENRDNWSLRR